MARWFFCLFFKRPWLNWSMRTKNTQEQQGHVQSMLKAFFEAGLIINGYSIIHLRKSSSDFKRGKILKTIESRAFRACVALHPIRSNGGRSAGRWLDAAGLADNWPASHSTGLHLVQEPCVICVGQTYVSCHKQLRKWWLKKPQHIV